MRLQPYRLALLNKAEEVSLFATLFVLMAGVVFMAEADGPTHVALAWAVVLAIMCASVLCTYVAFVYVAIPVANPHAGYIYPAPFSKALMS
eukprot:COSAG02_NODE_15732_length_1145_cov_1.955067_2_plen_91_part_00